MLHGEAANLSAKIAANAHYNPTVADPLDPVTFVKKIKVPVFMACQWEDEQTGGHCPDLVQHFTGTKQKWFTFTNGAHIDSLDPDTFDRWYDFLELFVAHQAPIVNAAVIQAAAPVIYQSAMGLPDTDLVTLPADPIQAHPDLQRALAAFEKLPEVRVLFDNGAGTSPTGTSTAGDPYPGFEQDFSTLPVPAPTARTWYLGPGGDARRPSRRPQRAINWYTSNAQRPAPHRLREQHRQRRAVGQRIAVAVELGAEPAGTAVSYVSAPLTTNTTVIGGRRRRPLGALVDPRRRSAGHDQRGASRRQRDVRPERLDLRASERKLSTGSDNMFKQRSTLLDPIPTLHGGRRRRPCRAGSSSRSSSRSTTRGTCTAPGRASG